MASTNGKEPADSTAAVGRARTDRAVAAASAGDPAAMAAEIERTREDLAGTLDAIADRVSPKRVAKRTGKKVAATVKESAAAAKESVMEGAAAAKEAVRDKTGKPSLIATPLVDSIPGPDPAVLPVGDLPPADAIVLPELAPIPATTPPVLGAFSDRTPVVPAYGSAGSKRTTQYVVAGAVALGLLLLLLRRRRR